MSRTRHDYWEPGMPPIQLDDIVIPSLKEEPDWWQDKVRIHEKFDKAICRAVNYRCQPINFDTCRGEVKEGSKHMEDGVVTLWLFEEIGNRYWGLHVNKLELDAVILKELDFIISYCMQVLKTNFQPGDHIGFTLSNYALPLENFLTAEFAEQIPQLEISMPYSLYPEVSKSCSKVVAEIGVKFTKIYVKDHPEGDLTNGYFGKCVKDSLILPKLERLAKTVKIY